MALQPLTGGMYLAAQQAFEKSASCIISFPGLDTLNEKVLLNYLNKNGKPPPYFTFSKGMLDYQGKSDGTEEYIPNTIITEPYDKAEVVRHFKDVDAVIAVPVCSGLSVASGFSKNVVSNKRPGSDAIQNYNQLHLLDYALKTIRPKVYTYENAPGLFTQLGAELRDELIRRAEAYGYSTTFVKTNTKYHGNPQSRERTFAFFWQWPDGKPVPPPRLNFWKKKRPLVSKMMADIPKWASGNDPVKDQSGQVVGRDWGENDLKKDGFYQWLHHEYGDKWRDKVGTWGLAGYVYMRGHYPKMRAYLEEIGFDEKCRQLYDRINTKYETKGTWWDVFPIATKDDKLPTLYFRSNLRIVHPKEDRFFTKRELMTGMGLPYDFDWPSDLDYTFASMVGQNVPVMTGKDMCLEVRRVIDNWSNARYDFDGNDLVAYHDNSKHNKHSFPGGFKFGQKLT